MKDKLVECGLNLPVVHGFSSLNVKNDVCGY